MAKTQKYTLKCIITGNVETYEITEIETPPAGRGGQVFKLRQKPSCLNYQCAHRDWPDCPLYQPN